MKNFTKRFAALTLTVILALGSFTQVWAYEAEQEVTEEHIITVENLVYERIELVSLIMRLAGFFEYNDEMTEYQRSLWPAFEEFADHPAVEFAQYMRGSVGLGFNAPMHFALHLEQVGDQFQIMEGSTFWICEPRWTPETADKFLDLVNDFYIESNFAEFFQAHIPYYLEISQRVTDELLSQINFDWFYQFGFGPEHLRVTIYPSGASGGYGPTKLDRYSYAILPVTDDFGGFLAFAVHEFAHSFANPMAEIWYEENEEFRRMSYDSVDLELLPFYGTSIIMAYEYLTRAFTILYLVENHEANLIHQLLMEITNGFPYIEAVFAMVTEHEPLFTVYSDIISLVLGEGVEYTLGEEKHQVIMGGMYLYTLDLMGVELSLEDFEHNNNGNMLETQTGDITVLLDGNRRYLLIDLGENPLGIEWGLPEGELRKYNTSPLSGEDYYTISQILGEEIEYTVSEEPILVGRETIVFYYQFMNLETEIQLEDFMPNTSGNVFSTQLGDTIIVIRESGRYLYIDMGDHPRGVEMGLPEGELRIFSSFPLDVVSQFGQ